jgi:hypothetical protein
MMIELSGGAHDARHIECHEGVTEITMPAVVVHSRGHAHGRRMTTYRRTDRRTASGRIAFEAVPRMGAMRCG